MQKIFKASMEFKGDPDLGEFRAVFSTLEVIDLDEDVTVKGAFIEGQEVIVEPWNHGWQLPAGKGEIHSDDVQAWIDGRFFLDTEVGRENYRTVKNLGPLAEWSYTFNITKRSVGEFNNRQVQFLEGLDVVGVSPVTRGAGIGTHTESIKSNSGNPEGETGDGKPSGDVLAKINLIELAVISSGV